MKSKKVSAEVGTELNRMMHHTKQNDEILR